MPDPLRDSDRPDGAGARPCPVRLVCGVQGAYFALTGAWALVDLDSFMAVTGPKVDTWLVKTVGALVLVSGAVMVVAAARARVSLEVALLAVGEALALALVDLAYVSLARIPAVYLLDALVEILIVAAWAWAWTRRRA